MNFKVLHHPTPERWSEIESQMWKDKFSLNLFPAAELKELMSIDELQYFCWRHGLYQLPTKELIDCLQSLISGVLPSDVMEIGAGAGQIGSHLGVRMTDSRLQDDPTIQAYYNIVKQPVMKYHPDVEKIDGNSAVLKYKPRVVIACWVTGKPEGNYFGIDEEKIISQVDQYIFVGNKRTHHKKRFINSINGEGNYFDWLLSRAVDQSENRIWIIENGAGASIY